MLDHGRSRSWTRTSDIFGGDTTTWGYRWRSSRVFVISVVCIAMFADSFLFSFIVPILSDHLERRIHLPSSQTQRVTSLVLAMNAFVSILIAPVMGSFADNVSFRNGLMILSWLVNIIGTVVTAWSTTLTGLFIGRLVQTLAGSLIWIVGMAILSDAAGPKNLAKVLSLVCLFISAGLLVGPAVSGALYELSGYLATWTSAFVILIIGTILQVAMMERSTGVRTPNTAWEHSDSATDRDEEESFVPTAAASETEDEEADRYNESAALLPALNASAPTTEYRSISDPNRSFKVPDEVDGSRGTSQNVYWLMLRRSPVTTALIADTVFAIIISSFEATLPIHIKNVFGWRTLQAGLSFLLLQLPALILLTPAGWLKDKIGMRVPVTVGFLMLAPSLWLLGLPGNDSFAWANRGNAGQIIFIVSLLGVGMWRTLILGFGAVEVMNGANELEAEKPGVFGPNGGYSRAFAMSNISWKLGMLLGPLISGALTESIGYYYMNLIFGVLCVIMGISTFLVLRRR